MTAEDIRGMLGLDEATYAEPESVAARDLATLASSVWAARTRAGLTQVDLGTRLGVNQSVVSRIESGDRNSTFATLMNIARATGTTFIIDSDGMTLAPGHGVSAPTRTHARLGPIETIEGIGHDHAARLRKAGIRTCEALLAEGATRKGRRALAKAADVPPATVLEWVNRADLMRVRGVGAEYSDLLEAAGVDTVKELRRRNAANLASRLAAVNEERASSNGRSSVRRVPALSMVEKWVAHARELPAIVTY